MFSSGTARVEMSLQVVSVLVKDTPQRQLLAQTELRNDMSGKHDEIEALLNNLTMSQTTQNIAAENPRHAVNERVSLDARSR